MSIFSDYECNAMDDEEFRQACIRINNQDRYDRELEAERELFFDEDEGEDDE